MIVNHKLILPIAGGSIGGIGPAHYCANLEKATNKPIHELADIFSGTSIGSPMATWFALGRPAQELKEEWDKNIKDYFSERTFKSRFGFCPKYSDKPMMKGLKHFFGNTTFGSLKYPLYICAWDARRKDIKVWSNKDTNTKVIDAIRASVAAPTYFSSVLHRYVDGGVAVNDPTLVAFAGSVMDGIIAPGEKFKTLSLVTSGKSPERKAIKENGNVLSTLKEVIVPAITTGNSSDVEFIMNAILKYSFQEDNLFTVRPKCMDYETDDVSVIPKIAKLWDNQFIVDKQELLKFITK